MFVNKLRKWRKKDFIPITKYCYYANSNLKKVEKMNKLKFTDISISGLNLNIFNGDFNKDALLIVDEISLMFKEYTVEVAIIGASHYISFIKNKKRIFSEVFACVEIPGSKRFKGNELRNISSEVFDYRFNSYIFKIDEDKSETIKRFKEENTLVYEFGKSREMKESAITGIIFKEANGIIELETIHVYPQENKAIVTNSFFNLS